MTTWQRLYLSRGVDQVKAKCTRLECMCVSGGGGRSKQVEPQVTVVRARATWSGGLNNCLKARALKQSAGTARLLAERFSQLLTSLD